MGDAKKYTNKKRVLFIFIVLILFIPSIQQQFNIFPKNSLKGAYELKEKPELSVENWFEGNFQTKYQMYLNDHLGFRSFFVRIYNQMHYSFYNVAKANGVIVGKENYLFEENYIKAHLGTDFIGGKIISEKVFKLKKIKDTLATKGIDLVVMLAPGKGSYLPEYIPDSYFMNKSDSTNYKTYKKEILASDINLLDFNKWFIELNGSVEHKLFPKNGIHWSSYAQAMVTDSLFNYLNTMTKPLCFQNLKFTGISKSSEMRGQDQDIEDGMNLMFDISDNEMAYPEISVSKLKNNNEPKLLTIGDSYYWGIIKLANSKGLLKKSSFWFYNKQVFPHSDSIDLRVEDIDIQSEIERNDVILLLATDANLYKFAFGFIDNVYDIYYTKLEDRKSYKREQRILDYAKEMRDNHTERQKIKEKAIKKEVSFEEELRNNAKYRIWIEDGKP